MSKVYFGNLDPHITERELEDECMRFGKIYKLWLARKPPGFAFVDFEDSRDAEDCVRKLDGKLQRLFRSCTEMLPLLSALVDSSPTPHSPVPSSSHATWCLCLFQAGLDPMPQESSKKDLEVVVDAEVEEEEVADAVGTWPATIVARLATWPGTAGNLVVVEEVVVEEEEDTEGIAAAAPLAVDAAAARTDAQGAHVDVAALPLAHAALCVDPAAPLLVSVAPLLVSVVPLLVSVAPPPALAAPLPAPEAPAAPNKTSSQVHVQA
eukprot:gene20574-27368_t